jgi:Domain of unknown function (DUF4440)/Domain of unknown function (DUF3471)
MLFVGLGTSAASKPGTLGLPEALKARLHAVSAGDRASWSKLTTANAFFVNDAGTFLDRNTLIEGLARPYPDVFTDIHDLSTHVGQADVVVSYAVQEVETFPSGPITRTVRRTETWVKHDGRWQMASGQATIIPEMRWNTVTVNPKLLADYVGKYQWYPGKIDTVTSQGSKLYSQWTGENRKEELLAVNNTTFFVRDDSPFLVFVRDARGRVTHYLLRGWDGQSLIARRVN